MTVLTRHGTCDYLQSDDVDLEKIAEESPPTFTGADYYGFCANALLRAVKRRCQELHDRVEAGETSDTSTPEPLTLQGLLVRVTTVVNVCSLPS